MSETYNFVCDYCKIKCWSGQRDYIYKHKYIADFLHKHAGHKLRFLSENAIGVDASEDYEDIEAAYDDPET